jgi:flagellum-specific ATP synthase
VRQLVRELPLTYENADGFLRCGIVSAAAQEGVTVSVPALTPGDVVSIERRDGSAMLAEVAAADTRGARCIPLGGVHGVEVGADVRCALARLGTYVGTSLFGCAVDAWGRPHPHGRKGAAHGRNRTIAGLIAPLHAPGVHLQERAPIDTVMSTGVAAIDAFATLGFGQRVSLAAGAGVGKTTLLRRIVAYAQTDARVVALIGERGREAAEACERLRVSPAWATTTVFCATSDTSAIERFTAARAATAQAEFLCRTGRHVLLVIDSLTRVATAWRELALAAGESPAQRGYPPSLGSALARLVERAGARRCGSITAVYTVLVDGDDQFEPVTDALRALLDGHIALARRFADAGRYPAIDVLRSLSRMMADIINADHRRDAALVRRALSTLEEAEDLFAIGAYRAGGDPWLDACVAARPAIEELIFDGNQEHAPAQARLALIATDLRRAPGPMQPIA